MITVIGDSWGFREWPAMLGVDHNLAVNGSHAADWAEDFGGRLTSAKELDSEIVIVSLLGNDARRAMKDKKITMTEILKGIKDMRKVLSSFPGKRVVVFLYTDPFSGTNPVSKVGVRMLNKLIEMVSLEYLNVELFPTDRVLLPEHFDGKDYHPLTSGYKAIADGLKQQLTS